jgi:hypothetical protein
MSTYLNIKYVIALVLDDDQLSESKHLPSLFKAGDFQNCELKHYNVQMRNHPDLPKDRSDFHAIMFLCPQIEQAVRGTETAWMYQLWAWSLSRSLPAETHWPTKSSACVNSLRR